MEKIFSKRSGFTLIEIIAALTITGILSLFAGYGILTAIEGFTFSIEASNTIGKGQVAMMRMTKEFKNLVSASNGSATTISYWIYRKKCEAENVEKEQHTLLLDSDQGLLLYDGIVLVDGVEDFTLRYLDSIDDDYPDDDYFWNTSTTRLIEVSMTLANAGETSSELVERIAPRNLP